MDAESLAFNGLRVFQIAVTFYAVVLLWRSKDDPLNGMAGFMFPMLLLLLIFSVWAALVGDRMSNAQDIITWAWLLYNVMLPLVAIRLVANKRVLVEKLCEYERATGSSFETITGVHFEHPSRRHS